MIKSFSGKLIISHLTEPEKRSLKQLCRCFSQNQSPLNIVWGSLKTVHIYNNASRKITLCIYTLYTLLSSFLISFIFSISVVTVLPLLSKLFLSIYIYISLPLHVFMEISWWLKTVFNSLYLLSPITYAIKFTHTHTHSHIYIYEDH